MLSVVVPCFNEAEVFQETSRRILAACKGISREFEIIYVDDGSRDGTWDLIAAAAANHSVFARHICSPSDFTGPRFASIGASPTPWPASP